MKMNRTLSRRILSFLVVGLMMQSNMPLLAQKNKEDDKLSTYMQKFKKSVQCALSKKGCTQQEAESIRAWARAIIVLLLLIIGSGLYYKFGRKKQPVPVEAPPYPQAPQHIYTHYLQETAPEKYQEAMSWWQQKQQEWRARWMQKK
jgi:hypothetical protein